VDHAPVKAVSVSVNIASKVNPAESSSSRSTSVPGACCNTIPSTRCTVSEPINTDDVSLNTLRPMLVHDSKLLESARVRPLPPQKTTISVQTAAVHLHTHVHIPTPIPSENTTVPVLKTPVPVGTHLPVPAPQPVPTHVPLETSCSKQDPLPGAPQSMAPTVTVDHEMLELKRQLAEARAKCTEMERVKGPECYVCMNAVKCILFEPCAHLVCCETCAEVLSSCPICRKPIASRRRVYT
jgi:hypothetical protein